MNRVATISTNGFAIIRYLLLMIIIWNPIVTSANTISKTIVLNFSENDFMFSKNADGELEINSKVDCVYTEDDGPCLPLIIKDIVIEGKYSYKSVSLSYEKRELMSNVKLVQSPLPVPTDLNLNGMQDVRQPYDIYLQYPSSNCQYVATSKCGNDNILRFITTPFVYNALENKVYFIDAITMNIELDEHDPISKVALNNRKVSMLRSFIENRDKLKKNAYCSPNLLSATPEDRIDYVIITNSELASSFKPLCEWKTEKGVYAKVITVEEINDVLGGNDTQLNIKELLYFLHICFNLKYVLLGGDDVIVPVRGCYGEVNNSSSGGNWIDDNIPTDMYYACFNGSFDWDDNKNGIYGEIDDNIDLTQSIFITRVPVRTPDHVEAFTEKLLEYEKNPKFNNNILMCGVSMFNKSLKENSDMEIKGDKLYEDYIRPFWCGSRYKFYDTYTDFPGGEAYDLNAANLTEQLEKGYSFMDMLAHGSQSHWAIEKGSGYYYTNGNRQLNTGQTIITTNACSTNAFDSLESGGIDPCLSESLIRNPYSGIVAYLGSSRFGWGTSLSRFGSSLIYEADFYQKLFSKSIEPLNFGVLVASTKASKATSCYEYNSMRWLQFGLNPIGDPEMPIWISEPKKFDEINISIIGSSVSINTSEDRCKICIVDEFTHGENYFDDFDNVRKVSVSNLPENSSICVTKSGFVPKQIGIKILQNAELANDSSYISNIVLSGKSITSNSEYGDVVLKSGITTMSADVVILGPGTKVNKGAELCVNRK